MRTTEHRSGRDAGPESPDATPTSHAGRGKGRRLPSGTMVDHFKVMRLIGRGGMGEVYLARDTKLGRRTALKIVSSRHLQSPEALEAFRREAMTTAKFSHPNI